jgi:hypothetical protein
MQAQAQAQAQQPHSRTVAAVLALRACFAFGLVAPVAWRLCRLLAFVAHRLLARTRARVQARSSARQPPLASVGHTHPYYCRHCTCRGCCATRRRARAVPRGAAPAQ